MTRVGEVFAEFRAVTVHDAQLPRTGMMDAFWLLTHAQSAARHQVHAGHGRLGNAEIQRRRAPDPRRGTPSRWSRRNGGGEEALLGGLRLKRRGQGQSQTTII